MGETHAAFGSCRTSTSLLPISCLSEFVSIYCISGYNLDIYIYIIYIYTINAVDVFDVPFHISPPIFCKIR